MSPKLPRMYWGEIIYATPGSGKTYVASKYDMVIDTDDLIVEAILERSDSFRNPFQGSYVDPRKIIFHYFRYINFNRRIMDEIYDIAADKMDDYCQRDYVVLVGTKDLMYKADRAFIQNESSIVRTGFNQDSESWTVQQYDHQMNIHYIDEYLDNSLQKTCRRQNYY
jgi:hypothetical protein